MLAHFLELTHNPAALFVRDADDDYVRRCIAARRLLPLAPGALLLPRGGSILADVAFANEQPEELASCLDAVRPFGRTPYHLPLTTYHSPLTTHHSPLTTHYSLLTTYYLLDVLQVRLFRHTEEWRILLIAADGAGRALAPNEQTRRFLQQRGDEARAAAAPCCRPPPTAAAYRPRVPPLAAAPAYHPVLPPLLTTPHRRPSSPTLVKVRMLDAARWEAIAAEVEPHLPPLLLRVALRESVKADTAPYRRHMVVLSHLEDVTEAKRRLGLQVQVCRPAALRDYLGWLQQTRASVAARG
jgi:hypothetical protein